MTTIAPFLNRDASLPRIHDYSVVILGEVMEDVEKRQLEERLIFVYSVFTSTFWQREFERESPAFEWMADVWENPVRPTPLSADDVRLAISYETTGRIFKEIRLRDADD